MSELVTMVADQSRQIESLKSMVHNLTLLVMKDKVNDTWINEEVAAEMVGYHPETFRRKVKQAHENHQRPWCLITFRNTRGRNWQYSRKSIIEFQKKTSIEL
jgi:hypothetical protein